MWLLKEASILAPMFVVVGATDWFLGWGLGFWGIAAWAGVAMLAWTTLALLTGLHSEYTVTLAGSHATFVTGICAWAIYAGAVDWSWWMLVAIFGVPWAASVVSLARREAAERRRTRPPGT